MNVLVKSSNGISSLPIETKLMSMRKLYLCGGIDAESANLLTQQLTILETEDSEAAIDLYINSPGGEVNAGLLIYDKLKGMTTPVRLYCTGMAASMAAIILAGGRKGSRFILPHSKVMIHEPLISGGVGGSATSIQRTAQSILETKRISVELLSQDTGRTIQEMEQAISFDNYMNAEEAVAFGLCDKIIQRI